MTRAAAAASASFPNAEKSNSRRSIRVHKSGLNTLVFRSQNGRISFYVFFTSMASAAETVCSMMSQLPLLIGGSLGENEDDRLRPLAGSNLTTENSTVIIFLS